MRWGFVAFPNPPEDYLPFAIEHGFAHMEIDLFSPMQWLERFHAARVRILRRQAEAIGITLSLHTAYTLNLADFLPEIRAAAVRYVERLLHVASELGALWVTVHPGYGIGIPTLNWVRAKALDGLKWSLERLLPLSERMQVPLALENINPAPPGSEIVFLLDSASEMHHVLTAFPSSYLKVCLDVGHAVVADGFQAYWAVVRERCVAVHIHDNDTHDDLHLIPGEGAIDWDEVVETLFLDHFDGALCVELYLDEHKALAKRFLEGVVERLRGKARIDT